MSEILNYLLGGGLLASLIGIVTLKATLHKANAEAEKARAEAESVRIDNAESATRILIENIVEPLKKELGETREELREIQKELGSTKREMARFRKAVESANGCKFRVDCPVLYKLRDHTALQQKQHPRNPPVGRQPRARDLAGDDDRHPPLAGPTDDTDGKPP